ncbi:MAG: hypothetical protein M3377_06680, partial [Actinomycetota bacterium]|nr:hypothetical protein [Actinomycetota bacterium]
MMRAALQPAGAEPRPIAVRAPRAQEAVTGGVAAGLLALTAAALFNGGASSEKPVFWVGAAALTLLFVACAAAATGVVPLPRLTALGALSTAFVVTFVLWNGATLLWSIAPDRSWAYFNRGLVYLAFLGLGLFVGALHERAPTMVAGALLALVTAALAWGLAGKVVPALFPDGARIARMREPVGYWNALALLFAVGIPLTLWLAGELRSRPRLRALPAVLVYLLVVGLLLTYSRGGTLVALIAVAAWLVASRERQSSFVALVAAVPVALVLSLWAFAQAGIASDGQPHEARERDGANLGLALIIGTAIVWTLAVAVGRLSERVRGRRKYRGRLDRRGALGVAAVLVAVLALAFGRDAGTWVGTQIDEFKNPPDVLLI